MTERRVAVCTVTYNAADDIEPYLSAIDQLSLQPVEHVVVDCASIDETCQRLTEPAAAGNRLRLIALGTNAGFAVGMNTAIGATSAPFVLSLNADALPASDFLDRLLDRFRDSPGLRIGSITGRLVRPPRHGASRLDAAGMRLTASWRHLDRGSDELDFGQHTTAERVFGGTGAATLYYRPALADAAVDGEFFLSEFHSFREDAELSFRLRERGWEAAFEPTARATHRRHNLPRRRGEMTSQINYHSLKNRFLLRAYHDNWATLLVTLVPSLTRDLAIVSYVLLRERSSLQAFRWLWENRRRIFERRRLIQSRRTTPAGRLASWFLRSSRPL